MSSDILDATSSICDNPTMTESALLEWATGANHRMAALEYNATTTGRALLEFFVGANYRMDALESNVQTLRDLVCAVGIGLAAALWTRCLCPSPKPYKNYKH